MSWIKVRTELPNSVKILKLQRILGCSRMEAVGLAVSWFAWIDAHCDSEVTHLALPDFQELLCPANASSVTNIGNASSITQIGNANSVTERFGVGNASSVTANASSVTNIGNASSITQIGNANSVTERFGVGNASSVTANASSVTRANVFVAFKSVGWITLDENGEVLIVDFEKHNGENAKRRALNAKRVARHKANASSVTNIANASSVTEIEENAKPLTHDALPREDKIREDNNNISISLKETSNQSNCVNNNTTVSVDVKSETSENAFKKAFSAPDDKMFETRGKTPNKPISVANKANSAQPCSILEVYSFLGTYFPTFTEDEHERIANEFFAINERNNWQNVTNWKLSLQRLIQYKYVSA